jgi:ATP-dependent Clp protease ATP-binding subunit ClpA
LARVAPEFAEALRVQRQRNATQLEAPSGVPQETELAEWSEHFPLTQDARQAFELAEHAALNEGHDHVGTEHLLLGLRNGAPSVAANVLKRLGVEACKIYAQLEHAADSEAGRTRLPLTPTVKRILQTALDQAGDRTNPQIAAEQILLAMLDERDSEAAHILRALDVSLDLVRRMIVNSPAAGQFKAGEPPVAPSTQFRIGEPTDLRP